MVYNISAFIQNERVSLFPDRILITKFTDGTVIQINKKDSLFLTTVGKITDSPA